MVDPSHLLYEIIIPGCSKLPNNCPTAHLLLLGTVGMESNFGSYLAQLELKNKLLGGLGIYQMEVNTHNDIWDNFIHYHPELITPLGNRDYQRLIYDLDYATKMARLHYYRVKQKLPDATNPASLGAYWKEYYNTRLGDGTIEGFVNRYHRCQGVALKYIQECGGKL